MTNCGFCGKKIKGTKRIANLNGEFYCKECANKKIVTKKLIKDMNEFIQDETVKQTKEVKEKKLFEKLEYSVVKNVMREAFIQDSFELLKTPEKLKEGKVRMWSKAFDNLVMNEKQNAVFTQIIEYVNKEVNKSLNDFNLNRLSNRMAKTLSVDNGVKWGREEIKNYIFSVLNNKVKKVFGEVEK